MPEKDTDQNTPKPVRLARQALSQLAAEGEDVSKPLSKALTAYALMLDKNGHDIDTEHLLHAARQGKSFLKQHTPAPQKQKKDYFETYLNITQNLPVIRFRGTDEYLLNRYIRTGDMEKFEQRLKNPDCTPTERDAAIYMAARKGSVECFDKLIQSGAKLRAVDDLPIRYALQGNHIPMVKALITHKLSVSDPHIIKDTLRSSYYKAVENGNEEIVNLIESYIPKQDLPKIQENALHAAACNGHTHLWQRLAQETTITEPAKLISSLLQAANAGYFETVKTICDTYADANLSFGMCLNAATKENHADIVDYLLPKIDKNDISYVMAALRNAIASAGNVNMAQKLYDYIEDALENRDNRYSKDDLIRHKKAFQREIGKISLTTPIENEYLEAIGFFIHLKNEVPADAFPQAIRFESFKTAEYLYNLKYNPDYKNPIKLRGDFNIDDVEELKDYCIKKQQWLDTVHQIPPHGLHDENPAFFKKRCFENIQKIICHEGYHNKTANILAFQAAALFQSEDRVLQYLEKWGRSSEQPLHNLIQMIKIPKEGNPNLKDWGDAVLKCGPAMAKLVKFADRLPSPLKSTDGKTWSMTATRDEVAQYSFQKASAHPKLAALCLELNMDEDEFETALKLIQKTKLPDKKDIPTLHIDGTDFDAKGYRFYQLPKGDIRGLFLGELTDCCQSIGNVGEACAKHGYASEHGGFYVVENAQGRIVAQTWAWRGQKNELCFDSLETLGATITPDQWVKILKASAKQLAQHNPHKVTALHVGLGGETPIASLKEAFNKLADPAKPKDYNKYRDSHHQAVIWQHPNRKKLEKIKRQMSF